MFKVHLLNVHIAHLAGFDICSQLNKTIVFRDNSHAKEGITGKIWIIKT